MKPLFNSYSQYLLLVLFIPSTLFAKPPDSKLLIPGSIALSYKIYKINTGTYLYKDLETLSPTLFRILPKFYAGPLIMLEMQNYNVFPQVSSNNIGFGLGLRYFILRNHINVGYNLLVYNSIIQGPHINTFPIDFSSGNQRKQIIESCLSAGYLYSITDWLFIESYFSLNLLKIYDDRIDHLGLGYNFGLGWGLSLLN